MSSAPFNDPLNAAYDEFSVENSAFSIPDHFDIYEPDALNQVDFKCRSVIVPSLEVGSRQWTINRRWIAIGIYQDEGREPFEDTIFSEERSVFRLLPSFKLLSYQTVLDIFASTAPAEDPARRSLYNVTTDLYVKVPKGKTKSCNYDPPYHAVPDRLDLRTRFSQAYDETGTPLPLAYLDNGLPRGLNRVDAPTKNPHILLQQPLTAETDDTSTAQDLFPYIYDFYGMLINDEDRGPYFTNEMIFRDPDVEGYMDNIKRFNNGVADLYTGPLFDIFGNIVVGIQESNAVVSRVPILPLKLDAFNRPIKAPLRKATS